MDGDARRVVVGEGPLVHVGQVFERLGAIVVAEAVDGLVQAGEIAGACPLGVVGDGQLETAGVVHHTDRFAAVGSVGRVELEVVDADRTAIARALDRVLHVVDAPLDARVVDRRVGIVEEQRCVALQRADLGRVEVGDHAFQIEVTHIGQQRVDGPFRAVGAGGRDSLFRDVAVAPSLLGDRVESAQVPAPVVLDDGDLAVLEGRLVGLGVHVGPVAVERLVDEQPAEGDLVAVHRDRRVAGEEQVGDVVDVGRFGAHLVERDLDVDAGDLVE